MHSTVLHVNKTITSILLCLLMTYSWAQTDDAPTISSSKTVADSIKQYEYLDLAFSQSRYDIDACLSYSDSALLIANMIDDGYVRDLGDYYLGVCYNRNGMYDSALSHFNKALIQFEKRSDTIRLADIYYQIALVHRQRTEHVAFINNINKSYDLSYAVNYQRKVGMCLNAKLINYTERDKIHEAEEIGLQSLSIFETIKDSSSMGDVLNNLGNLKTKVELYDEALKYHMRQHDINLKVNNVWGLSYSHGKLGNLYLEQRKVDLADFHLNAGLDISRNLKSPYEVVGSLHKTAKLYLEKKQYQKAIALCDEALEIASTKKIGNPHYETLELLSLIHEEKGDLKKALQYQRESSEIRTKTLNETISDQLIEIETKYETEKKEAEIERLSLQEELNEVKISRQKIGLIGAIGGIGLLSFLLYRIYGQKKHIQSQNKIISKALSEKDTLLREIHHRVKNNLQVVSSLLGIQSRHTTDEVAIDALQESQNRVQSMSLIHQDLYQKENLSGIKMQEYLKRLVENLFATYNISPDKILLTTNIEDINLDVDTVVPLGLIINELITNALKYAFPNGQKGEISILLKESDSQLKLQVADNGIGITDTDNVLEGDSFGYSLIQAFAHKLEADIQISSEEGTAVTLQFDNYRVV